MTNCDKTGVSDTRQDTHGMVESEPEAPDAAFRTYLMDQRRLYIGQVRSIERILGIEPEVEQLKRENKVLKRLVRELQGQLSPL